MDARLTETQLAEFYGVTVRTVQRWRITGSGPQFIDIGKNTIRYRPEDIAAYENGRAKGGEIPARARKALERAAGALGIVLKWPMKGSSRTTLEGIRGEVLALLNDEGGA